MRKTLLVANWKMNGSAELLVQMQRALLAASHLNVDTVICPPFVFLPQAQTLFANSVIAYGAQDVSDQIEGAYTGQISAKMLSQLACRYVIIGHCERRRYCAENNALIAAKCVRAVDAGLIPILCVGEDLAQKQNNETSAVVLSQLRAVLDSLTTEKMTQLVVAYEPVWAIGSGQAASPELAESVHGLLRSCVAEYDASIAQQMRILYGGSVNAQNISTFLSQTNIDGALIGGASLKPDGFIEMVDAANNK